MAKSSADFKYNQHYLSRNFNCIVQNEFYKPQIIDKKDESFDALRGIAIIAVIAIHASGSIFDSGNASLGNFSFNISLLYRQALNFAVPTFSFISGYWMYNKSIDSLDEYKRFLMQRLTRVVIPYLFWSIVVLLSI